MSMLDTAKLLVYWGALLSIILGIVEVALSALSMIGWWWLGIGFGGIIGVGMGIVSIILGFLVWRMYFPRMEEDPKGIAIYLLIFGIILMIVGYGIGGLLILVGGILVMVEKEID